MHLNYCIVFKRLFRMSSSFDCVDFCNNPSVDKLRDKVINKDDWKFIATNFKIPYESSHTKEQIKNLVIEALTSSGVFPQAAGDEFTPLNLSGDQTSIQTNSGENNLGVWSENRLTFEREHLQLELKKLQLQLQHESEQKERDRQLELTRIQYEFQQRERERLCEIEKNDKDRQIQIAKVQQAEEAHKLEVEKLQFDKAHKSFNLSKAIPLVPPFDERDPEMSFENFEKTAKHLKWPKDEWVWLIQPKLTGKAILTLNHLDIVQDYDFVKKAILDAYAITPDNYRRQFRNYTYSDKFTYLEFAMEKLRLFKKWLHASVLNNYDDLMNAMVLEEWKRRLPFNVMVYVEEKGETDLIKAAQLADSYALIHRKFSRDKSKSYTVKTFSGVNPVTEDGNPERPALLNRSTSEYCTYCKKTGHNILKCKHPNCKTSSAYKLTLATKPSSSSTNERPVNCLYVPKLDSDLFSAFKVSGTVSVPDQSQTFPVTILRDTGSTQSVLCKNALPGVHSHFTGETVNLKSLGSGSVADVAVVRVISDLINGEFKVAVLDDDLPVPGVNFILGNDLAGSGLIPNLVIKDKPLETSPTAHLDKEQPHIFPVCAITRSQAVAKVSETKKKFENSDKDSLYSQIMCRDELCKCQQSDPSLAAIRHVAEEKEVNGKTPNFYYSQGVLMRSYSPPDKTDDGAWATVHQVVLPSSVRTSVMELAHEGSAGHLGQRNTYKKLLTHFFWPGMKKAVTEFVKSCPTCQVVGKPNDVIPKSPLYPIPVISEPFEKIVVDCVGPLPKTKRGNQYLLTVMCTSTRYPEAFPLRSINAKSVIKQLLHLFTRVGIPHEIQTDQGTNFTSDLMNEICKELDVTKKVSTAYRPQTQGCLERFHQSFKSMMKKYCCETEKEWDENVDFLLFAVRECPQESLGYSPFELLYGRQIRGPLKVLKDSWFINPSEHSTRTVTDYIDQLKSRLTKVREIALKNLKQSQTKMKNQYDKDSKVRKFAVGDKVLLFLPIPGSPLKSKYSGPYEVIQMLSPHNYVLKTPDRRKSTRLAHINQMKLFIERKPEKSLPCLIVNSVPELVLQEPEGTGVAECVDIPSPSGNPVNSIILNDFNNFLTNLSSHQQQEIKVALSKYPTVTSDSPGFCNTMLHDVILKDPLMSPIKQPYYRLNPQRKQIMESEINYLLEKDLVEPSFSPWASPSILVPKPDGSSRLCTDYRKVNSVTVPDAYPLPRIDDLIDKVGHAKYVSTIDLQKGYYQIGLTERAKLISAFTTHLGLFQYKVMPFGMINAPATFQRIINHTIQGLKDVESYLDDIIIFSDSWNVHLASLEKLLGRLASTGFTINLAKSRFGQGTVSYLGHEVGRGATRPKKANIQAIISYPRPSTRKDLLRFIGMAGFYRRFCPNFASVIAPLTDLTSTKTKFSWSPACDTAFEQLKKLLSTYPVLRSPDPSLPYHLQVDACDQGVGAVLLQKDPSSDILHPVSYFSVKLKKHQRSYSTVEKECLSLVLAIKKYECYISPNGPPLYVYTDHNPLTFIHRMKNNNQRILRWALFLQEYNLQIQHIRGVDNLIADALSRLHPAETELPDLRS